MHPWKVFLMGNRNGWRSEHSLLSKELLADLKLQSYVSDAVSTAIGEIDRLPEESTRDWHMRKMVYVHVTRMLAIPLDRADRMSMATGLELRVPYCDHRLVEYVFNTPWMLKTFDGREKSLLRQATREVLPASVSERMKSGYPLIHDPAYTQAIMAQAEQLIDEGHAVLDLVDSAKLKWVVRGDGGIRHPEDRRELEQVLSIATWLDLYRPELRLS
jgi:asparagine synthase (glutamine-hydrolysing)